MTKEDFIKKFPDIKVQQFETETILSKQEIMDIVWMQHNCFYLR